MNNYSVYIHTNILNNKKYIGITKQQPEARWKNGKGYKTTSHFRHAIDKYGWENFSHEIIYTNLSAEEAGQKEKELIQHYNTTNSNYGYNNSTGGEISFTFTHSKEARKKMSESHKKLPVNQYAIEKMKEANSKKVQCIETGEIFNSASEAKRIKQIKGNHITECCKGERKTCGGFHWKFVTTNKDA